MPAIEQLTVDAARERIAQGALLLDVREDSEFEAGHSADAVHVALSDLPDHVGDFDPARPIICVCRSGARSARAATFLLEQGLPASNLEGGMMAWDAAGAPMVADAGEPVVA